MLHNILITGASGYLGGSLLHELVSTSLPTYDKLYALVRTNEQAIAVRERYGAEPLTFSPYDDHAVRDVVTRHNISVVYFLIDALKAQAQVSFIQALAQVKANTGIDVHFLHTTGAKLFSSHAGAPTDAPLLDADPNIYDIHKAQKAPIPLMDLGKNTNCTVVEESLRSGVQSYIFAPCIVYGKGTGFGNVISIQTVAIVKAAKAARRMYKVDTGNPTWPVCHIADTVSLYIAILRSILSNEAPPSGKEGFYLAASGSVSWEALYARMAQALHQRQVIDDSVVALADDEALKAMAKGIGCEPEMVAWQLGGKCTFTAKQGLKVGWAATHGPEHALDSAADEVALILDTLDVQS